MQIMKTIVLWNMASYGNLAHFAARPKKKKISSSYWACQHLALLGPIQSTLLRF
jgi:hypothetical protein